MDGFIGRILIIYDFLEEQGNRWVVFTNSEMRGKEIDKNALLFFLWSFDPCPTLA